MRYCPKCDSEYRDAVTNCSDDGTTLVSKQEYEALLAQRPQERERFQRLSAVVVLTDPFEAEELAEALAEEQFDVSLVSNRSQPFGWGTSPGPEVFSIVVPDRQAERARILVAEWQDELERQQPETEQAAVSEELAGEHTHPAV